MNAIGMALSAVAIAASAIALALMIIGHPEQDDAAGRSANRVADLERLEYTDLEGGLE